MPEEIELGQGGVGYSWFEVELHTTSPVVTWIGQFAIAAAELDPGSQLQARFFTDEPLQDALVCRFVDPNYGIERRFNLARTGDNTYIVWGQLPTTEEYHDARE